MLESKIVIINRLGLHARAAAKLAQCANQFSSDIKISKNAQTADGKSIMSVMMLAAGKGTVLKLVIIGDDENQANHALTKLIANGFGEDT